MIEAVPLERNLWYYGPEIGTSRGAFTVSSPDAPDRPRRDILLGMIQKEYPNYHPLVSIARIAHHGDAPLDLQFKCHQTIAKYVEPELKSLEVKGEINGRHKVSVSLFEQPGTEYTPLEAERSVLEGTATRVLPGGATVDMDPATTDRVVGNW